MKKWISILVAVALAVTTITPSASYASTSHTHSRTFSAHLQTVDNCSHHKDSHTNPTTKSAPCCDKHMCKCIGGNCHAGMAKMSGNNVNLLPDRAFSTRKFALVETTVASVLPERLKRPPKA